MDLFFYLFLFLTGILVPNLAKFGLAWPKCRQKYCLFYNGPALYCYNIIFFLLKYCTVIFFSKYKKGTSKKLMLADLNTSRGGAMGMCPLVLPAHSDKEWESKFQSLEKLCFVLEALICYKFRIFN